MITITYFCSVVKCSAVENTELFQAIPWSHGTLGFVVAVEIQIIPSSPYVRVEYLPFEKKELAMESFIANSRKTDYDFVECLAYSQDHYVVMLGKQVESYDQNNKDIVYNPIGLWYKQWFYLHVKEHLKTMKKATEIIPIRDYYHRHTRSLFWELQDIVPFGNNIVFRYLLGWMMPPKPSLMKLTQTEELRKLYELHHVVQDMLVPINTLSKSLEVFHQEIGIYPLWLCPFRIHESSSMDRTIPLKQGFIHPLPEDNLFVDIGAYGNPTVAGFKAKDTCRRLEDYVRKCKGYQMMYADSYMTK